MNTYLKLLKVSTPKGHRIRSHITSFKDIVNIKVEYLKEVELDKPPFAKKGKIIIKCEKKKYQEVIKKLTKYLEDLFLKELLNEDIHPSIRNDNVKRGNAKKNTSGKTGSIKGKGDSSSVYSGTGRKEQTEKSEREIEHIDMDKSNNTSVIPED